MLAVADTHTVLWYLFGDPRLSERARVIFDDAAKSGRQIGFSTITLAEILFLIDTGRLHAEVFGRLATALEDGTSVLWEVPFDRAVARAMELVGQREVPNLPDRAVAATALHLGVPLLSRDRRIRVSSIETIW